jgi:hypothetical protein
MMNERTTSADSDPDRQISLTQASRLPEVQCNGHGPNVATLWRWTVKGVRGIKLESSLVGGRRVTTPAAVRRFVAALSNPRDQRPSPAHSVAAHRAAELELAREGI